VRHVLITATSADLRSNQQAHGQRHERALGRVRSKHCRDWTATYEYSTRGKLHRRLRVQVAVNALARFDRISTYLIWRATRLLIRRETTAACLGERLQSGRPPSHPRARQS
jgi:hypothetical protein